MCFVKIETEKPILAQREQKAMKINACAVHRNKTEEKRPTFEREKVKLKPNDK